MRASVIMSVYNGCPKQIEKAADSILSELQKDMELILLDDGSRENIRKSLVQLSKQDKRIRYLRNETNRGLAESLNRCLQAAAAPIVIRQDADDISLPGRVEKLLVCFEKFPEYDIIGSNTILFDETGPWGGMAYPEFPQKRDFLFCLPFLHGACAFRKEAVLRAGGYRGGKLTRRCEDFELLSRMYAAGSRGYNIQEALYAYREDAAAVKRRKYRHRVEEAAVKYLSFQKLGLLPGGLPYVCKPLIVGLLPQRVLEKLKDWHYGRRWEGKR